MNLVVDVGNTLIKLAVFDQKRMVDTKIVEEESFLRTVKRLFETHPTISNSLIASVAELKNKEVEILALFAPVHQLTHNSKVPYKNSYASPHTLGVDRMALATAAFYKYPRANVLVIDAGTCITYDMVNDYGEYLGGAIAPGVRMRYRAMHEQTARLPKLEPASVLDFIGNTTENCMHSGVLNGVANEVDGVIDQYKKRFKDLTVILTGGEAQFFGKRLKNSIFADSKFLLEGLNYLLEYNKQ